MPDDPLADLVAGAAVALAHELSETGILGIQTSDLADKLGMAMLNTLQTYLAGFRAGLDWVER